MWGKKLIDRWSLKGGTELQNIRSDIVTTRSLGRIEGLECIKHLLGQSRSYLAEIVVWEVPLQVEVQNH